MEPSVSGCSTDVGTCGWKNCVDGQTSTYCEATGSPSAPASIQLVLVPTASPSRLHFVRLYRKYIAGTSTSSEHVKIEYQAAGGILPSGWTNCHATDQSASTSSLPAWKTLGATSSNEPFIVPCLTPYSATVTAIKITAQTDSTVIRLVAVEAVDMNGEHLPFIDGLPPPMPLTPPSPPPPSSAPASALSSFTKAFDGHYSRGYHQYTIITANMFTVEGCASICKALSTTTTGCRAFSVGIPSGAPATQTGNCFYYPTIPTGASGIPACHPTLPQCRNDRDQTYNIN